MVLRILERDGAGRWREAFVSGVLRGGDEPLAIRAELHGATGIELVVDAADRGDVLDRTIWLDPVVISAP
ncbi:MAG: hypothetical protein EBZ59_12415 [Planctomycetia bacterium]|nr:hypothetical protein [Planctomycetia bacterium]